MNRKALRRVGLAAALMGSAALPAAAQVVATGTVSQCIPFAVPQAVPFTEAPKLSFSVQGSARMTVTMDTGSVGVALASGKIPGYAQLKASPAAKPGYQFLSSSKVLWVGTWVPVVVTLFDGQGQEVATATVPILGVEQSGVCQNYANDGTCPDPNALQPAGNSDIVYMGVGFGREADYQPQGTPDKNVLLNLATVGKTAVTPATFKPGYIIGTTGVTVGLTPQNTQGFGFVKLQPLAQYNDWQPVGMCISINGAACAQGTALIDTGIPQSYVTVPSSMTFQTVSAPDASEPSRTVQVLAPGTTVSVAFAGTAGTVATDAFTISAPGIAPPQPQEPLQVIPWMGKEQKPTFINTGRHFLRQVQFLYDPSGGHVGFKPQSGGCGG
ncbi:MAG TPA: hypothetical protein VEB20_07480 [Azospirillaceae bacterium]|nr:hypothetical protein [Azospirillaceae bacterium]